MKKLLCILLFCFLFAGCTPSEGPFPKEKEQKPVRLARIGGDLYYETGEENTHVTCGTLDGHLKKDGKPFSVPTEDGTVNFDGAEGYQNYAPDAKTVFINNEGCRIFKKIDAIASVGSYTHAYAVSGKMRGTDKESTLLVLANDDSIDFESAVYKMMDAKPKDSSPLYVLPLLPYHNAFSLSPSVRDVTPTGLTLIVALDGEPTGQLQTGLDYKLMVLEKGEWKDVPYIAEPLFPLVSRMLPSDHSSEHSFNWSYHYGSLQKGHYKLIKDFTDYRGPANFDTTTLSVEFDIA